jgi:hypothetical protein
MRPDQAALRASSTWPSRSAHSTTAASTGVGLFQCVQPQAGQRSALSGRRPPFGAQRQRRCAVRAEAHLVAHGRASGREHAGGQVAVAAVADDEHDGRVLAPLARAAAPPSRRRPPRCRRTGLPRAPGGAPCPRRRPGSRRPVRPRLRVVDLRQVGLGPLADARDARALAGLRADDAHRRVLAPSGSATRR